MTTPTPTPDTLRAAAERAVREFDRPGYTSMPLALMSALDALRAALAASPAPTDTSDERPCTESHGFRWAPPHTHARPASVTAPREDEGGRCGNCGHTRTYHTEKALTWCCWPDDSLNDGLGCMCHEFRLAAAPAVEGATPDPDTLAELMEGWAGTDGTLVPVHVRQSYARALVAAGVTLDETASTQEDAK